MEVMWPGLPYYASQVEAEKFFQAGLQKRSDFFSGSWLCEGECTDTKLKTHIPGGKLFIVKLGSNNKCVKHLSIAPVSVKVNAVRKYIQNTYL